MADQNADFTPPHIHAAPLVPTVKIVSDETEQGFIIINESDFDPKTMKKYKESKAAEKPVDKPAE